MYAEGDGWGYNLGLLIAPDEKLRIGAAYRSAIDVHYDGELEIDGIAPPLQPLFGGSSFKTDTTTDSSFPEIIGVGVSYRYTDKLTAAFDIELVRWSEADKMESDLDDEVPAAGITDSSEHLEWKDSWQYKLGFDYQINEMFSLRGGYAYLTGMVTENHTGPENPDADQHNYAIGAGYSPGPLTIDIFYIYGKYERVKVNNGVSDGEYVTETHYLGISGGYGF